MSKLQRAALALISAAALLSFIECSINEDKKVNERETASCRKFCEVRNTNPKTVQPGICICE